MKAYKKDIIKRYLAAICLISFMFSACFTFFVYAEEIEEEDEQFETEYYFKGNDDYLSLEAFDVEEGKPGCFFVEAEEGVISGGIMTVVEDADASSGAGIAAPKGITRADANSIKNVDARFRFKVTEPGLYKIYVRAKTPASKEKSTHISFDDDIYRRIDYSTIIGKYVWLSSSSDVRHVNNPEFANFTSAYLDEGVHILNIKARQGGHIIDDILITNKSWSAQGFGSLPGDPYRYTGEELEVIEYENSLPKLIIDGNGFKTDAPMHKVYGETMVPMRNLVNFMGANIQMYDDHYLAYYDRDYIKIYIGSDKSVVNGCEVKMSTASYLYEDNILMVPLSALQKAFDFDYTYEADTNTTTITTHFLKEDLIRRESKEILETEPYLFGSTFKLKIDRPNARVKVWLKRTDESLNAKNRTYTKKTYKLGWKGLGGSKMDYYWGETFPTMYKDGYFEGDCGYLYMGTKYDMKVSVVDGDYTDTFIIENAIEVSEFNSVRGYEEDEDFLITGGALVAVPTFENIGYYIDEADPETTCSIFYKKMDDTEWKQAYTPFYDKRVTGGQYRGSIVYLNEDTVYEIKAEIKKEDKIIRTEYTQTRTWTSNVPVSKTINISELYKKESDAPLVLRNIKGSEDGWIKIIGDGKTVIDAGHNWKQSVYLADCEYVILEGLIVKGGDQYGINISHGCSNIRVINCDVSAWSATAVLTPWLSGYVIDGNGRNLDAGIRVYDAKNVVIERCYIHDTIGNSNPWSFGDTSTFSDYWVSAHPAGTTAVLLGGGQGIVIRYNDMSGSDQHRFNDVMECEINSANYAGPGFDSDIYGNLFYCSEDDSIEIDSSGRNVRVYENRFEQSLCGISTAPINIGPLYIFRNLITNRGNSQNVESNAIKINAGEGMQYIFNNTMSTDLRGTGTFPHGLSRNNITTSSRNGGGGKSEIADYDIITGSSGKPSETYQPHGFFDKPDYVSSETGDYRLKENSLGVNQGQTLLNFSDVAVGGTDIGAFESGGKYEFFPYRPLDAKADKYYAEIFNKKETTVTFTLGEIPEGLTYRIHTNEQNEFLHLTGIDCELTGIAESGKTYTVKMYGDLSNHFIWLHNEKLYLDEGNGMLYFRLSNGLSVPVTVCVKK